MLKKAAVLLAMLAMYGCTQSQTSEEVKVSPPKQTAATVEEILGDIPVYPGFKVIPEKSFTYQSGNIKVGRVILAGDAKLTDIVNFYTTSLSELGWEAVSTYIYGKTAFMDFLSDTRSLQIQVEKTSFSGVRLVIQVGPRGEILPQSQQENP